MQKATQIEAQIEKTLGSLDGIKKASPVPFFFTRVQAALNNAERNVYEKLSVFITRPAILIAGICFILLLNVIAVFDQKNPIQSATDNFEQLSADEYNIAVNSYYQYENPE
jgi:hypothetical protein